MTRPAPPARGAPRTWARFPVVPGAKGHYESFYLKAGHPAAPLAVWIRYTVHKPPEASPTGSLWFTLFDGARDGGPRGSKVTLGQEHLGAGQGDYIRIGGSRFAPGHVVGRAPSDPLDAAWELEFEPGDEPLRHLPREWMYRWPVPRTKLESPHPATRFTGRLTAAGQEIEVRQWPGMVGHNWGAEHAERWIWLHGTGFQDRGRDTWLDVAIARVRLGRLRTPWIANGLLRLDGVPHRLGGVERARRTQVRETPHRCEFELPGKDVSVGGAVEAPGKDTVGWLYADPAGPEHHVANCSIASMRLEVRRRGAAAVELSTPAGATYELGTREPAQGVELQPFP